MNTNLKRESLFRVVYKPNPERNSPKQVLPKQKLCGKFHSSFLMATACHTWKKGGKGPFCKGLPFHSFLATTSQATRRGQGFPGKVNLKMLAVI